MCMSKNNGGLGFRGINGFNLALLGKQCWRLINEPGALVARVLKARYYPNSHFLQASRTGGVSYTWSGLWEAKEEMKKGLRWVLGDGKSINIASDRWLRLKDDFCVNREQTNDNALQMKVCEFFQENNKAWDEVKIRSNFNSEDAVVILNTRIPQRNTRDRIAWIHSKDGKYSVKSGYYQWCQLHLANEGVQQSKGWSKIWKLGVPHKIRTFLWRFYRNTLPVRILLRGRGVPAPLNCSLCTVEIEHLKHLFFECTFAKECWQQTGLDYATWDIENIHEWVLHTLANGSNDDLVKISTVLWGVWFARNKRIFENKTMTPVVAMSWSGKQILEWQVANKKPMTEARQVETRQGNINKWQPPESGSLKINVDASVVEGHQSFAIGMVLRDHQGCFITGTMKRFAGMVSVKEAELTDIVEALLWARENTTGEVLIESDSVLSIQALTKGQENLLELGDLIQQGSEILKANERLTVRFVRNQANKVAHRIARIPCEPSSFIVISSPPIYLLETLLSKTLMI